MGGNAYDNGNRVFNGELYTVTLVVDNQKEKINGETCGMGVIVRNFNEDPRENYPYVWSADRFEKVED